MSEKSKPEGSESCAYEEEEEVYEEDEITEHSDH